MKATNQKQINVLNDFVNIVSNHTSAPSEFVGSEYVKTDPETGSEFHKIRFENHYFYFWVGVRGAIRCECGHNLKAKNAKFPKCVALN